MGSPGPPPGLFPVKCYILKRASDYCRVTRSCSSGSPGGAQRGMTGVRFIGVLILAFRLRNVVNGAG